MIRITILLIVLCSIQISYAQQVDWVQQLTTSSLQNQYQNNIRFSTHALTPQGDSYVVFAASGPDSLCIDSAKYPLSSIDYILAKFDSSGNYLWHTILMDSVDFTSYTSSPNHPAKLPFRLETDQAGNCYIGFNARDSLQIDTFNLIFNFPPNPAYHIVLVKVDPQGNLLWVRNTEGFTDAVMTDMTIDKWDNIIMVGEKNTGFISLGGAQLFQGGGMIMASWRQDGTPRWLRKENVKFLKRGKAYIATGADGDFAISGPIFLGGEIGTDSIWARSQTTFDGAFLAYFDSSGQAKWAKTFGGEADSFYDFNYFNWEFFHDQISGVQMDEEGNVYVLGAPYRTPSPYFGLQSNNLPPAVYEPYVIKVDSTGQGQWAMNRRSAFDESDFYVNSQGTFSIITKGVQMRDSIFSAFCFDSTSNSALLLSMDKDRNALSTYPYSLPYPSLASAVLRQDSSRHIYLFGESWLNLRLDGFPIVPHYPFIAKIWNNNPCEFPFPSYSLSGSYVPCLNRYQTMKASLFCDSGNIIWSTGDTANQIILSQVGAYSYTIEDSVCGTRSSDTVFIRPSIKPIIHLSSDTICEGDTAWLSILNSQEVAMNGGFSYYVNGTWAGASYLTSSAEVYASARDQYGCVQHSDTLKLHVIPNAQQSLIIGDSSYCFGDSLVLSVDSTRYQRAIWSTGDTTFNLSVTTGSYTVRVIDPLNCGATEDSIMITPYPVTQPQILGNTPFCAGDSIWLSVDSTSLGNAIWSNGHTHFSFYAQSGTYSLMGTDTNGCDYQSDTVVTTSVTRPATPSIVGGTYLCPGDSLILQAPTGHSNYLWSNGAQTLQITIAAGGLYSVTVLDQTMCWSFASTQHVVTSSPLPNSLPIQGASINDSLCMGDSIRLTVSSALLSSVLWSTGDTSLGIYAKSGTYHAAAIGMDNCSILSDTIHLKAIALPSKPVITGDNSLCKGDSVTLSVSNFAPSYVWSNGSIQRQITVSTGGTHTVRVKGPSICWSPTSDPHAVTAFLPPTALIIQFGDSLLTTTASTYQWYSTTATDSTLIPNAINQFFAPPQSGTYFVIITAANGCKDTSDIFPFIKISIPPAAFSGFHLYPNPTSDKLQLAGHINGYKPLHLRIYNAEGKLLREAKIRPQAEGEVLWRASLAGWAAGVYQLQLVGEDGERSFRFVKK